MEAAFKNFKEIGIYLNMDKPDSPALAEKCINYLIRHGFKIALLEGQIRYPHDSVIYYQKNQIGRAHV